MNDEHRVDQQPANTPAVGPQLVGGLAALAELLGGESQRSRTFLGGLVIGALVGAAVAGGSFIRHRPRGGGTRR